MRWFMHIMVALIVTGCSFAGSRSMELDEAERLMLTDPTAALSKLNQIDVSAFQDSALVAKWALLYSEAMVANRLSAPTDTIVNIAIDFYGRHNLTHEFKKASSLKALLQSTESSDALSTALYLQKEREFFIYKERARHERFMLGSLIVIILAVGIIVWMRQRMRMQNLRNEALMAEASGLRIMVNTRQGDVERLESRLHGLLENRFALIDSLCQTYYETQGTKAERKAIIDKVKSEIESVRNNSFNEMEQAVNNCRDNILVKVKELYPDIKSEDYRLLVYIACGLSTRTVSLLMCETVDVIYKRKSRLKARIKETVMTSCPEIMTLF